MKQTYKAILISPDGEDYVTDFERDTKEEVIKELENIGSKWFFYPIAGIITADGRVINHKRIEIQGYGILDTFNGRTVQKLIRYIKNNQNEVMAILQNN